MSKSILIDTFDAIIGELPRLATMAMQEERAAVVAWLREEAEAAAQTYTLQAGEWANRIDGMADAIKRGAHEVDSE